MTGWKSHHEVLFENIDIQDVYEILVWQTLGLHGC